MATYQNSRYNMALPSGSGGNLVLIKTLTASSSATLSFVDGASDVVLDNTYRTYMFRFINIHPATDSADFTFNMSADTGSNYNVTKTTTYFDAIHAENGTDSSVNYNASRDMAQSTAFQIIARECGNGNDESTSGELYLFSPSSTTFLKHFIANTQFYYSGNYSMNGFGAGYGNTTSAVDAVQFKMSSGNIDSGTIKLYGIA
jgi:hypothetical protein